MTWDEFCALLPSPDVVTVEAYEGSGAYGDIYAPPVQVSPCIVEESRRLVRVQTQDAAGKEQISSTTVYAPLVTVCPPGSRVTLPATGRVARVLAASRIEAKGLDLPEHLEINLE